MQKKSSNVAVFGELGRKPLYSDILKIIAKFWVSPVDLIDLAYNESVSLANDGKLNHGHMS